jgi:hypothetical protein
MKKSLLHGFQSNDSCQRAHGGWYQDFFIMEYIVASQGFSEEDMICRNCCCMAFRAMTAADVLTGGGIRVTQNAINLRRLSRPSSKWDWPNGCPSNKDVSHWKSGLKQITLANFSLPFISRLERWIKHPHLRWQWFYWQHERHLYHHTNGAWHHYVPFSTHSTVAFKWVGIVLLPLSQSKISNELQFGKIKAE